MSSEQTRLDEKNQGQTNWLQWGPYLSERQWGTVREDYSDAGDAWNYTTHDRARSYTYRWGEEGLAGLSDDQQLLCVGLALWNGQDPILKERLFGLTNEEGNHGEDVKELYYYLDNTPTHTYQKMLYKYPQAAFPYQQLLEENHRRGKTDPEFELIDTGLFDENRYFDVFAEYAKNDASDLLLQYTIHNRGDQDAPLHVLPQLWFRNIWSWADTFPKPEMRALANNTLLLQSEGLGEYVCYAEGDVQLLFTENETNTQRLYNATNASPYVKDGINNRVVNGDTMAVNPEEHGTKAAIWYQFTVPAGGSVQIRLRLSATRTDQPFADFDAVMTQRQQEADDFYATKQTNTSDADEKRVQRQAWAGLLWSKQFYYYNVNRWLKGDPNEPAPPAGHAKSRNFGWQHFIATDIMSMPDTWEYPWFAAWDLAFHCIAFAPIDANFAKKQLQLLVNESFLHPNGQLPAYEWNFSDVNPPVHALAAWRVFKQDRDQTEVPDYAFLEGVFQKLLLNFTWWVNRKDSEGNNIFEGGFLGLDNIGVFNRSAPIPGGGNLEQADGTSWMAMYSLNLMRIAMELALHNPIYEDMAIKFAEHFLYIAGSMGTSLLSLWDDQDGFYYDQLRKPDGSSDRLRLRTVVGLIPMFASIVFDEVRWQALPKLVQRLNWFMAQRPDLTQLVSRWRDKRGNDQHLLSLLRGHRMKLLLRRMLDETEFLSPYGIRSVSKFYSEQPYSYWLNGQDFSVHYTPAESDTNMFGGNSNWRGPIWVPMNFLLIDALKRFHHYYTDDFQVEYPTNSGQFHSLADIAALLSKRLKSLFLRDPQGQRPVFGGHPKLNTDEHFRDYILFHEYFDGDTGKGLGASHQTGWTALIAVLD